MLCHAQVPRYQHDCTNCVYLGEWYDDRKSKGCYDLYVCIPKGYPEGATLIARYGNEGHEYESTELRILATCEQGHLLEIMRYLLREGVLKVSFELKVDRIPKI